MSKTNQPIADINIEEVKEIAPILNENQVETLLSYADEKSINIESIAAIAPFLSQNFIDRYAKEAIVKINP